MSGHWGGNNNNQKKRARGNGGWGTYYKNKNANKKDRYVEFDSSTSRAINAGQQPTLARKRRQLAQDNNKWGNNNNYETTSNQRAQDIFQDLIANHEENKSFSGTTNRIKANPTLINTRKKFWRRKLSSLSTKDYDTAWKEGRNMFLKFVNSKDNGACPAKLKDRVAQKNPPPGASQKSKAAVDDSKTKKAKKDKKHSDKNPGAKSSAKSSASTTRKSKPTLDVIDLCDSDSDDDNRNGSQSNEQVPATGIDNNAKQVLTKTEAGVSEPIPELNFPPSDLDPTTTSPPVEEETLNAATELRVTKTKVVANRWSDLFLGPNFRTNHIFSLDNGTI